jgi:CHASE1-domain containing sensor protein
LKMSYDGKVIQRKLFIRRWEYVLDFKLFGKFSFLW